MAMAYPLKALLPDMLSVADIRDYPSSNSQPHNRLFTCPQWRGELDKGSGKGTKWTTPASLVYAAQSRVDSAEAEITEFGSGN